MKRLTLLFVAATLLLCSCKDGSRFSLELIPVKSGEKWGYIDKKGKFQINPQFDEAHLFVDDLALVKSNDGKYGFIGVDGKFKINLLYKKTHNKFSKEGLVGVVQENGKIQFIDKDGNIKATIENADICGELFGGLANVKIKDKWGFIDASGNIRINPTFDKVSRFREGLAAVAQKEDDTDELKWGFIDNEGKLVINYQFSLKSAEDVLSEFTGVSGVTFSDGLAPVSTDGEKWGYINKEGNYEINPQFDKSFGFKNGFALVRQADNYGFIDKTGKYAINPQFINAYSFSGDLAPVQNTDGKWGFINKEGKYEINPQFDNVLGNFIDGIAIVKSGDVFGFINEKGAYVVNPQFEEINLTDLYISYSISSDFVDVEYIVNQFLKNTDEYTFNNITADTTLRYIVELFPDVTEDDLKINSLTINYPKDLDIDDNVYVSSIIYFFLDDTYTKKAIYKKVKKYNYWTGSYETDKQFDRYEKLYNNDVKTLAVAYTFYLRKTGKGKSKMLGDEFKKQFISKSKLELREHPEIKNTEDKGMYILSGDGLFVQIQYSFYEIEELIYATFSVTVIFNNYAEDIEKYEKSWIKNWEKESS